MQHGATKTVPKSSSSSSQPKQTALETFSIEWRVTFTLNNDSGDAAVHT
jgi:hypothetical protein